MICLIISLYLICVFLIFLCRNLYKTIKGNEKFVMSEIQWERGKIDALMDYLNVEYKVRHISNREIIISKKKDKIE